MVVTERTAVPQLVMTTLCVPLEPRLIAPKSRLGPVDTQTNGSGGLPVPVNWMILEVAPVPAMVRDADRVPLVVGAKPMVSVHDPPLVMDEQIGWTML